MWKFSNYMVIAVLSDYKAHKFINRRKWALIFQETLCYWKICPIWEMRNIGITTIKSFLREMYDCSLSTQLLRCLCRCWHGILLLLLIRVNLERSRDNGIWRTISGNGVNTYAPVFVCICKHQLLLTRFFPLYILTTVNISVQQMLFPLLDN